ncbi:hypothetical protein [Paraburkholderia aspalathi]|uniref:hypothetical protein n=1 Tax=Paraburkholderia aspalathi TaxID=1324617 RepID=UPI0038BB33C2
MGRELVLSNFIWILAAAIICMVTVGLTLMCMGRLAWHRSVTAQQFQRPAATPSPKTPFRSMLGAPVAALRFVQDDVDVLAQLEAAHATPYVPNSTSQSTSLPEAFQRAMRTPAFDSLAGRTDPEGLFEAAAWAMACLQGEMPDAVIRCSDGRLRDPRYAEGMMARAAGAGQPGAILELAMRYPTQWNTISLDSGVMLEDAIYMLARHGDMRALDQLRQWCTAGNHCRDPLLTRNVLMLLMLRVPGDRYRPEDGERDIEGSADDQQRAATRVAEIRLIR